MTPPPSEDEGLQIIPPEKLLPKPPNVMPASVTAPPAEEEPSGNTALKLVLIFLFVSALIAVGFVYLLKRDERRRPSTLVGTPENVPAMATPTATPPLFPVNPEALRVTSIALGDVHLAVVNGQRLAEGDPLVLTTPAGVALLRVKTIEDGVVHFDYGGQLLDAKLLPAFVPKTPAPVTPH
jgi:hypothetical protein